SGLNRNARPGRPHDHHPPPHRAQTAAHHPATGFRAGAGARTENRGGGSRLGTLVRGVASHHRTSHDARPSEMTPRAIRLLDRVAGWLWFYLIIAGLALAVRQVLR